ncbi:PH domain-containing protein [Planococcus dechangensis]|uniref:PH domain-containing protein n=1 Tax=Planococcus dechangensis TaxID=1176255 RepID=A0ABV9M999_9BACL
MTFRSKIDRPFLMLYGAATLLIAVSCFWPFFFDDDMPLSAAAILISIFVGTIAFMLWLILGISYVFRDDHIFVKAGPLRTKIAYEDISLISPTSDILTGMRMLSSRDALEIFYPKAVMDSVKISPAEQRRFLDELMKRVPRDKFHRSLL